MGRGAEFLKEYLNPRGDPPWDMDDLVKKMEGAYRYATQEKVGGNTAEADFKGEQIDDFEPTNPKAAAEKAAEISRKGRTRAINKIRKLREVNEANKSAPEEIAKARKDEAKWMAKYGLTDDDINGPPTDVSEGSSAESAAMSRRWVYLGFQERFLDLHSREMGKTQSFDKYFASVRLMDKTTTTELSKHILLNILLPS